MDKYLCIYDVRGIQEYIFRTKPIKEIVGASVIVRDVLNDSLKEIGDEIKTNNESYNLKWFENQNGNKVAVQTVDIISNDDLLFEVIYEGGGNLVVAFKSLEVMNKVNDVLQEKMADKTYSLSLAYASTPITNSFTEDLKEVKNRLSAIKTKMPLINFTAPFPLCKVCPDTGYSLTLGGKTVEAKLKENAYNDELKDNKRSLGSIYLDSIANPKTNSGKTMLAFVHIDGNNIGLMIQGYYKNADKASYDEEVKRSRELSLAIEKGFNQTALDVFSEEDPNGENHRVIINSGDDMTFICKAENSLSYVKKILQRIGDSTSNYLNPINGGMPISFHACAGISLCHSHFPFYRAYQMAEECCENAKKKAKKNGQNRSFFDWTLCQSGVVKSLDERRKFNNSQINRNNSNYELYSRPIACNIEGECIAPEEEDLINFEKKLKELSSIARSSAKEVRDTYLDSISAIKLCFKKLESRKKLVGKSAFNEYNVANYFDASEVLDFWKD